MHKPLNKIGTQESRFLDIGEIMENRYEKIIERLLNHAQNDEHIFAIIKIGSRARKNAKADEHADLDLIMATDEMEDWLFGDKAEVMGNIKINFIESVLGDNMERKMLFESNLDVDLMCVDPDELVLMTKEGISSWIMNRGYEVLYDRMGIKELLSNYVEIEENIPHKIMNEDEFKNVVNDFAFHTVSSYKKILRGELWTAKMCTDAYLKERLLQMIEAYELSIDRNKDIWHNGRFLDDWASSDIKEELKSCFGHYDSDDLLAALRNSLMLFSRLASAVAKENEYDFPAQALEYADVLINA